jgi:hypothetical protein
VGSDAGRGGSAVGVGVGVGWRCGAVRCGAVRCDAMRCAAQAGGAGDASHGRAADGMQGRRRQCRRQRTRRIEGSRGSIDGVASITEESRARVAADVGDRLGEGGRSVESSIDAHRHAESRRLD